MVGVMDLSLQNVVAFSSQSSRILTARILILATTLEHAIILEYAPANAPVLPFVLKDRCQFFLHTLLVAHFHFCFICFSITLVS